MLYLLQERWMYFVNKHMYLWMKYYNDDTESICNIQKWNLKLVDYLYGPGRFSTTCFHPCRSLRRFLCLRVNVCATLGSFVCAACFENCVRTNVSPPWLKHIPPPAIRNRPPPVGVWGPLTKSGSDLSPQVVRWWRLNHEKKTRRTHPLSWIEFGFVQVSSDRWMTVGVHTRSSSSRDTSAILCPPKSYFFTGQWLSFSCRGKVLRPQFRRSQHKFVRLWSTVSTEEKIAVNCLIYDIVGMEKCIWCWEGVPSWPLWASDCPKFLKSECKVNAWKRTPLKLCWYQIQNWRVGESPLWLSEQGRWGFVLVCCQVVKLCSGCFGAVLRWKGIFSLWKEREGNDVRPRQHFVGFLSPDHVLLCWDVLNLESLSFYSHCYKRTKTILSPKLRKESASLKISPQSNNHWQKVDANLCLAAFFASLRPDASHCYAATFLSLPLG